jgi:hypothetical protein
MALNLSYCQLIKIILSNIGGRPLAPVYTQISQGLKQITQGGGIPGIAEFAQLKQFIDQVTYYGLENIDIISLDHDLGPSAMAEWHSNVYHNYELNYDNIEEKTGMDCTKWLVEQWLNGAPVVDVVIHSANAVGSGNMMGYINNYRHIHRLPQNCVRVQIEHTV